MIQKQPGTDGDEHTILLNGREVEKFILKSDKTISVE
ncbi:MAG: hypothetical protein UU15_C0014G0013 [Candidatus Levybacteria bacterium GW2011_GWC2_40_7]|nr:MAG: hypothetical protein UU15_C0014G0013 [Candidatus Levybacteria bacterium GW2011_GWC2_40_7]